MSLRQPEQFVSAEVRIDRLDSATLEGLEAFGQDVRLVGGTVSLRVTSEDVIADIARWLVGQGIAIRALNTRRKTLEEWFIEVMGEDQRPG